MKRDQDLIYTDIGHDWDLNRSQKEELWLIDKDWNFLTAPGGREAIHGRSFQGKLQGHLAAGRFVIDKSGNKKASLQISYDAKTHQVEYIIKRASQMLDKYYDNPDIVVFR